jgi:hypothetical protein
MARIYLDSNLASVPEAAFKAALQTIFFQLEDQINAGTDVIGLTDSDQKLPEGMQSGDLVVNLQRGEVRVGLFNGATVIYASFGSFVGAITDAQHGTRAGGNLHELVTTVLDGFMSSADKVKLNRNKGDTVAAGPASLTEYPADGDYGFHEDTVGLTYSLAKNKGGVIFTTLLT